jgi:8-oxo-dGTP pyrophosphatase MutT (NUDIX family)
MGGRLSAAHPGGPILQLVPALRQDSDLVVTRALVQRRGRVLLVRRAAWDSMPGHWELPGGKSEHGESDEAALARELAEETALTAIGAPAAHLAHRMWTPSGRLVDERVYRVEVTGLVRLSAEHDEHLWWHAGDPLPGPLTSAAAYALDVLAAEQRPRRGAQQPALAYAA